jgi:predicted SAM-dependent methyltransferase
MLFGIKKIFSRLPRILLRTVMPAYLVEQIVFELRMLTRYGDRRATLRKCKHMKGVRANVGCGTFPTPGWVNLDVGRTGSDVLFWDCRSGLPFADASLAALYSEHCFEHLDYETEALPFLRECFRCLAVGGVLRIVVPDAGRYLKLYACGGWEALAKQRPLIADGAGYRDHWRQKKYTTKMQFINYVFRQDGEHKYAYDEEALTEAVRQAGFSDVKEMAYRVSRDPLMAPDSPKRTSDSLYVEGAKPNGPPPTAE